MNLSQAINAYKGEMRRAQFSVNAQERYGRELERFMAHVGDQPMNTVDVAACRSFIDSFDNHAPSTVALEHTILSSFFKFAVMDDIADLNPMLKVRRPKVKKDSRKLTRITTKEVQTLLAACETWPERICLHTLAYMGVRKTALANLRWGDVDGKKRTATFLEKGNKRITKPVPQELWKLWTAYTIAEGPFDLDDWVVPFRRETGRRDERNSRLVYHVVKTVAARCGINSHVHAFRAAFAVHFLTANPAEVETLRMLMGHASIATTQGYLDLMDTERAMKRVDTLSFVPVQSNECDLGVAA